MTRGRDATSPVEIPPTGWWDVFKRVWLSIGPDHIGLIAAGCAFYGLLAIFPAITAIMALAGLVTEPDIVVTQLTVMTEALPDDAASIMIDQAREVAGSDETGLGLAAILGLLLAIYSASLGVFALMEGLNVVFNEREKRSFVKLYGMRIVLTLMLIGGFFFAVFMAVGLPAILSFLLLGSFTETVAGILRWPILLLIASMGIALLYRWGPSRRPARWRWLSPGVILSCILWVLGTYAFAYYASNFGSYNETFGTLSGAILLLMWMWLSAFIILLGAEFDAQIEAQVHHDTTTGPSRPPGQRGAAMANRVLGEPVAGAPPDRENDRDDDGRQQGF